MLDLETRQCVVEGLARSAALLQDASPVMLTLFLCADALDLEGRQCVVEGLARIAALLPPAEATQAGLMLISPFLHRAKAILGSPGGSARPFAFPPCACCA